MTRLTALMDIEGSSHIILTAMNGVVNFRLWELREHDKCCRALSSTIKLQFDIHRDLCRPQSPLNQLILVNRIMVLLLTTSMTSLCWTGAGPKGKWTVSVWVLVSVVMSVVYWVLSVCTQSVIGLQSRLTAPVWCGLQFGGSRPSLVLLAP